jgi:putative aldouronate transport system permease protein
MNSHARNRRVLMVNMWRYRSFYIMLLPAIVYYLIFHYYPMYGAQIAFKDFKFNMGISGSPWVGFEHFVSLFSAPSFYQILANTLIISFYKLIFGFPAPILFALLLNEVMNPRIKKVVQTISYLPHFISWVVLGGVFILFLSPTAGPINSLVGLFGFEPIFFLGDNDWFRSSLVWTHIWKGVGWGSIIYFAALAGIDTSLYEAAEIDGANRFHKMFYITIPSMFPVITIMFIFAVGGIINDDFDQVFNLYSPAVYQSGDVISTYVYRKGLVGMEFSFATAVGLFKNVIGFTLIIITNQIVKKYSDYSLW